MVGPVAFLAPVFVQVALTFVLLFWGGTMRIRSIRTGQTASRDVALGESNWPPPVLQVMNAYQNQFELPVLFYLVTLLALFTGHPTVGLLVFAWLFVVSRLLHALVHVTTNNLPRRFFTFLGSLVILLLMWLLFAAELLAGGPV